MPKSGHEYVSSNAQWRKPSGVSRWLSHHPVQCMQVFRGVHWSDDVLNHENIGFWHYLQPAYNVMGFISCAGTNFLLRSAPFAQAGHPPKTPSSLHPFWSKACAV